MHGIAASLFSVAETGQVDRCTEGTAACSCTPTIDIRYGDFSIDLSNGVDEEQLPKVLRVRKHAD